jgi:ferredoxin-type protein NapH
MKPVRHPGAEAVRSKGWLLAYKWLLARRFSQLSILALFLVGPWFGVWLIKGNLNSSLTLDVLPLTDPYVLLQSLLTQHVPEMSAIIGALIVVAFYLLVGGRVYCSWVCPVNMVTDTAHWLRERLGITGASRISRTTRYWILGATLVLALVTGTVVWELVNPVSMLHRGLIFGMGLAWAIVLAVFFLDLLVSRRAWCGHLCPVGAFYSLMGSRSLVRVRADQRQQCDDCMDCFVVCPEPQVIRPALKGEEKGVGPVITSPNCTNCGRCIDVCTKDVFRFGSRFNNRSVIHEHVNHSPGVEAL